MRGARQAYGPALYLTTRKYGGSSRRFRVVSAARLAAVTDVIAGLCRSTRTGSLRSPDAGSAPFGTAASAGRFLARFGLDASALASRTGATFGAGRRTVPSGPRS